MQQDLVTTNPPYNSAIIQRQGGQIYEISPPLQIWCQLFAKTGYFFMFFYVFLHFFGIFSEILRGFFSINYRRAIWQKSKVKNKKWFAPSSLNFRHSNSSVPSKKYLHKMSSQRVKLHIISKSIYVFMHFFISLCD